MGLFCRLSAIHTVPEIVFLTENELCDSKLSFCKYFLKQHWIKIMKNQEKIAKTP